eukprot:TRINITY_DN11492_c0_g1_i4.p1 TRINITY_DN11492_c0_g1~~TRINITY_DN11492_c0_g1_i4.p1  ORF type:complete len:415 (+),score=81.55 TRINITY_DN11492_c0_g1_i4:114-1358(+)
MEAMERLLCLVVVLVAVAAVPVQDASTTLTSPSIHLPTFVSSDNGSNTTADGELNPITFIQHANWTAVVTSIRNPANQGYFVSLAMIASVVLAIFGYRFIRVWLFLGGFISAAATFYIWSPSVIDTSFCCGKGTDANKVNISLMLGIIVGMVALWILKIGIFLTGASCGLAAALGARSLLGHWVAFSDHGNFAAIYLLASIICGFLALYVEKPIIVATTSFIGSFFFCAGIGYFRSCNFLQVAAVLEHDVIEPLRQDDVVKLPPCDHILVVVWLLLSVLAMIAQYQDPFCRADMKQTDSFHRRNPDAVPRMVVVQEAAPRRSRRRGGGRDRSRADTSMKYRRASKHEDRQATLRNSRARSSDSGSSSRWGRLGRTFRARTQRRQQRLGQRGLLDESSSSDSNEGVYHAGRITHL